MVIVPVADDGIPEPVLRALATYDPDFVVPFAAGAGGQATDWLPAPALEQLRRHLSAPTPDEIATAPTMVSGHHTPSYPLTPVDEIDAEAPASLEAEGSDQFRLLLAARVGKLSDIDRRQCVEDGREIEEVVASPGDYGLIHLAYRGVTPGSQLWNDTAFVRRLPLGRSMHSCVYLRRGVSRDVPAAVVVGDDVSDFALALLLDRMYGPGHGMWLPTAMLDGTDGKSAEALLAAAQSLERLVAGRAARVTVTSTSSTGQTLLDARTALSEALGSGSWSTTDDNSELTPFLPEGSINIDDPLDLPMSRPLVLADPIALISLSQSRS